MKKVLITFIQGHKDVLKTWEVAHKILAVPYTKSQLIADLKDMSKTLSLAGNRPTQSSTPSKISDKDMQRVQDILSRAGGNEWKAEQLTTLMANKTADKSKLQARGDAMKSLGKDNLAQIFYSKLTESKIARVLRLLEKAI